MQAAGTGVSGTVQNPARVQTRADTSLNIETKHGHIIRAIIQQSSQSAHCEPVSFVDRA